MALNILPCPFCGSRAALNTLREGKSVLRNRFWRGWIKCSNQRCGATSMAMRNSDAAIKWWNRRVPAEQILSLIEEATKP